MKRAVNSLIHHHHHDETSHSNPHVSEVHDKHVHETHHVKHITKEVHTTEVVDSSGMIVHKHVAPAIEETVLRPAVLEEVLREDVVVEVQPVIHRLIEIPEVHHIEKHVYEKVLSSGPQVITREPIIEVTIQPKIIEEVQTIVHREVAETYVVHEEQHISEHVVRPTVFTKEVIEDGNVRTAPAMTISEAQMAIAAPPTTMSSVSLTKQAMPVSLSQETTSVSLAKEVPVLSKETSETRMRANTWEPAEPHKRVLTRCSSSSKVEQSSSKWVAALPKAMLKKRESEKEESKEKGKKEGSKGEHDKEASKDKAKDKITKKSSKKEDGEHRKDSKEEILEKVEVPKGLVDMNDPAAAHAHDAMPTLERPKFVERTVEHSSLDVRAMLSLERRADLLTGGSDLPGYSAQSHSMAIDRGADDLERGSHIGLSPLRERAAPNKNKDSDKDKMKEKDSDKEKMKAKDSHKEKERDNEKDNKLSRSTSPSHKNKLEQDLRKMNADQASSRFVLKSLKADN